MKKRVRTGIIFTILVIIAIAIAILRPWENISILPIVNSGTALTVNTPLGKAEVYLDEKKVGETPFSSENLTKDLSSGLYLTKPLLLPIHSLPLVSFLMVFT